ncbi:hypothetical protein VTI28DRAFT_6027 [Corynascus sepedonium]
MAWVASYLSFGRRPGNPSAHRRANPRPSPALRSESEEKIPVSPSTDGASSFSSPERTISDTLVVYCTPAEAVTMSLDLAVKQMTENLCFQGAPNITDATEKLSQVRGLVQKVRYQQSLQIPNVMAALESLGSVIDQLVTCTARGTTDAHIQLKNVMIEIDEAATNLRQQFPGHFAVAENNRAIKAFQANAAIGLKPSDERVITEARGNDADGSLQFNAPVFGDTAFLAQIAGVFGSK